MRFLSTPSARRATFCQPVYEAWFRISIHALREEGDQKRWSVRWRGVISIHALREEGDNTVCTSCATQSLFLSTPSARRATPCRSMMAWQRSNFYPRPPRGGRLIRSGDFVVWGNISIHALREEGDEHHVQLCHQDDISIHALREEGDDQRPDLTPDT